MRSNSSPPVTLQRHSETVRQHSLRRSQKHRQVQTSVWYKYTPGNSGCYGVCRGCYGVCRGCYGLHSSMSAYQTYVLTTDKRFVGRTQLSDKSTAGRSDVSTRRSLSTAQLCPAQESFISGIIYATMSLYSIMCTYVRTYAHMQMCMSL